MLSCFRKEMSDEVGTVSIILDLRRRDSNMAIPICNSYAYLVMLCVTPFAFSIFRSQNRASLQSNNRLPHSFNIGTWFTIWSKSQERFHWTNSMSL